MYPVTWSQSVRYCILNISIKSRRFNDIDKTGAFNILNFLIVLNILLKCTVLLKMKNLITLLMTLFYL